MVDWRAPVAEPFYRATGLDPQGLARRRHLAVRGRTVLGLEDEYFVDPSRAPGAPIAPGVRRPGPDDDPPGSACSPRAWCSGGPGALLSALGQARTGHMGDIIGTIQREQDEIIRSPLSGVLVVQGGPGTGKTAVALHRAAYLLYTHRFPLERQGVLVVGPNPLFLRYIEQVLPSLGETGVSLSTVAGLVPEIRVRGTDDRRRGHAQGRRAHGQGARPGRADPPAPAPPRRRRALRGRGAAPAGHGHRGDRRHGPPPPRDPQRAPPLRRGPRAAGPGRRLPGPAHPRRRGARRRRPDAPRSRPTWPGACAGPRRWPRPSTACGPASPPTSSCTTCWGPGPCWPRPGRASSSAEAIRRLYRPRSASLDAGALDGGRRRPDRRGPHPPRAPARGRPPEPAPVRPGRGGQRPGGRVLAAGPGGLARADAGAALGPEDDIRSFGHIVVDEVQDLSPMQLRMLARRSLSGSMTVVGDIAQATGPWAPESWDDVTRHLSPQRATRLVELTVSYRTPGRGDRGGGAGAGGRRRRRSPRPGRCASRASPPASSRPPGPGWPRPWPRPPGKRWRRSPPAGWPCSAPPSCCPNWPAPSPMPGSTRPTRAIPWARAWPPAWCSCRPTRPTASSSTPWSWWSRPWWPRSATTWPASSRPVATTRGLRTLYVALTRPTRRLAIVHAEPLPVALAVTGPLTQLAPRRGTENALTCLLARAGRRRLEIAL